MWERGAESFQGELTHRGAKCDLARRSGGSRLLKADTAICIAETSRRQGTWKRNCKPTQRGRCKRRKGRRQADLGEKAPGSVKSGLNGSCHSAAQPLIYV